MGLFNLLSTDEYDDRERQLRSFIFTSQINLKEEILVAIKDTVTQLRADIAAAGDRVVAKLDELDTLRADRDRLQQELDALRTAEDAEDVEQNAAFAAKQAEVDAKVAEIADAESELRGAAEDVAKIGVDPEPVPAPEPAVEPAPEVAGPSETVADGEVTPDAAAVQDGDDEGEAPAPPAFV